MTPGTDSIPKENRPALSAEEIGELLGKSRQAVDKKAKKYAWPVVWDGKAKLFRIEDLPPDVRQMIAVKECPYTPAPITPEQQAGLAAVMTLSGKRRSRAEARACVVNLYRSFAARAGMADTPCRQAFAVRWAAGEIEADPDVRAALPRFSPNSLKNWVDSIQKKGASALGGVYGKHRKGTGIIDSNPEMRETVLGMIHDYPHASVQLIRERLESIFTKRGVHIPSMRRLRAWVSAWKAENSHGWEFIKAPDTYRSRFLASVGNAYELVTRQNQRWEYDGTPADLLLNDGKRYTIVGVVNIYDRKAKLDVVERSTATAVANLTRRALLDWGVPEMAVTDNGKDFVALYLQQVFASLSINHEILPPFRPDLKPGIERFFRTFSHHMLTLLPGYVGHNVVERQAIRERETFAKRLMNRKKPQEIPMAVDPESLQRFCDQWCDDVYAHKEHSGLNGRTPFEVACDWIAPVNRIEEIRALDLLLTPLPTQQGRRTVSKKGVKTPDGQYAAPELGGMIGSRVQVRVDPNDTSSAYIFNEAGKFVCRAAEVSGISSQERRDLAVATRRAGQTQAKAVERELRGMAKRTGAAQAAGEIMAFYSERAEHIRQTSGAVSQRSIVHTTPELEAAAEAANAHIPAVAVTEQAREIVPGFKLPATPRERYLLFLELKDREDLSEAQAKWVRKYPDSQDYALSSDIHRAFAVNG
jgi:hypothetical protein